MGDLRTVVVADTIVGQQQGVRQHPSLAVILIQERVYALLAVAAAANPLLEVRERHERQDGVAQLGLLVLIHAPEATWVPIRGRVGAGRMIAFSQNELQVVP